MNSTDPHSSDAWIARNLNSSESLLGGHLIGVPYGNFRLHALPILLAISAIVVATMWYQESQLHLLSAVDRIGYPLLLIVTTCGAILLKLHPASMRTVLVAVFSVYVVHMLGTYYQEMGVRLLGGQGSSYELTILMLWLPLGYVGGFVFFSPPIALRSSLAIYAAVALPQLILLGVETDAISRQLAVAILVAPTVYIAALWGVGLLKVHTSDTHDIARSMSKRASVDVLTGIANRHAMMNALEAMMRSQLTATQPVALMLLDVDNFKRINDTYGHGVGDEVLMRLAKQAQAQQRSTDLLARWGGEEFMILAFKESGSQAVKVAERLRRELETVSHPLVGRVTVSIGVTSYVNGEELEAFIHRADLALYRAKELGRNRVEALFD